MNEIKKKLFLRFTTTLVLTACFCVMSSALVFGENLHRILTLWGESLQMTVYLSENISPENATQIETTLKNNPQVDQVQLVTKEKALIQFREQMASYAPDLLKDDDLLKFIPSSFQFALSKEVPATEQLSAMTNLASSLKVQPGVDEVSYGQDWVKNYSQVVSAMTRSGQVFSLVIVLSALFVISNCIRSSIYQRKDEIEVLELIGATAKYIRKPFYTEGAVICGVSAILGLAATYAMFAVVKDSLQAELSLLQIASHLQFLNPTTILSFVVGSLGLGVVAAFVCLRSLNDGWAAAKKVQT